MSGRLRGTVLLKVLSVLKPSIESSVVSLHYSSVTVVFTDPTVQLYPAVLESSAEVKVR